MKGESNEELVARDQGKEGQLLVRRMLMTTFFQPGTFNEKNPTVTEGVAACGNKARNKAPCRRVHHWETLKK